MAGDNKYGFLKNFVAGTIATASLAVSSSPAGAAPVPARTSATTQPINKIDQSRWTPEERAVYSNVDRDLKQAGLKSADYLYPFPERSNEGAHFAHTKNNVQVILGEARKGPDQELMQNPLDTTVFYCPSPVFQNMALFEGDRIFGYVHETGHKIDHDLHLTDQIRSDVTKGVDQTVARNLAINHEPMTVSLAKMMGETKARLNTDVGERQADMTATLYIMGNMPNYRQLIAAEYNFRRAAAPTDPEHNTASSIAAAAQAYSKNPRPGISVVDAAKWSAKILDGQKGQINGEDYINNLTRVTAGSTDRFFVGSSNFAGRAIHAWGQSLLMIPPSAQKAVDRNFLAVQKSEESFCGDISEKPNMGASKNASSPAVPSRKLKPFTL